MWLHFILSSLPTELRWCWAAPAPPGKVWSQVGSNPKNLSKENPQIWRKQLKKPGWRNVCPVFPPPQQHHTHEWRWESNSGVILTCHSSFGNQSHSLRVQTLTIDCYWSLCKQTAQAGNQSIIGNYSTASYLQMPAQTARFVEAGGQ